MNLPQRRNRLPKPALQLKLIGVFLGLGVACTLVQFSLLSRAATKMALALPEGRALMGPLGDLLWTQLGVAMGLLVPLTVVIGTIVTFRVAGPIYHFEQHLRSLLAGRDPGRLRIREEDELGELSDLLQRVLERRGAVDSGLPDSELAADGSAPTPPVGGARAVPAARAQRLTTCSG